MLEQRNRRGGNIAWRCDLAVWWRWKKTATGRNRFACPNLKCRPLAHDDLGAHRDAFVQIDDIIVHKPKASRRDCASDRLRLIGAVDPVDGAAKVERSRPHRIARTARHEARQVRLSLDHLRWRG